MDDSRSQHKMNFRRLEAAIAKCEQMEIQEMPVARSFLQDMLRSLDEIDELSGAVLEPVEVILRLREIRWSLQSRLLSLRETYQHRGVTIVMFGKTRAGKSTLVEALVGGDGKSIGIGYQGTTQTSVAHKMWHDSIRLIDTPGIEAIGRKLDVEKARESARQADLILFVIQDDSVQSAEFEQLDFLKGLGKPLAVVLNVKESDLVLLCDHPDYVFKADVLREHSNRIQGFLRERLLLKELPILPIHARGAFESNLSDRDDRLACVSRLDQLKAYLIEMLYEAPELRLTAFYDQLLSVFAELVTNLELVVAALDSVAQKNDIALKRLTKRVRRIHKRSEARVGCCITQLNGLLSDVPSFVDQACLSNDDSQQLWRENFDLGRLCREANSICREFANEFRGDCEGSSTPTVTTVFKDPLIQDWEIGGMISNIRTAKANAERARSQNRYGKLAAGLCLGGLGLTNFWNPAGGVAIVASGAALTGLSFAADAAVDKIIPPDKAEEALQRARESTIETISQKMSQVIYSFHADYAVFVRALKAQLRESQFLPLQRQATEARELSQNLRRWVESKWVSLRSTVLTHQLSSIIARVGSIGLGAVTIARCARWPGKMTKIVLASEVPCELIQSLEASVSRALREEVQICHRSDSRVETVVKSLKCLSLSQGDVVEDGDTVRLRVDASRLTRKIREIEIPLTEQLIGSVIHYK